MAFDNEENARRGGSLCPPALTHMNKTGGHEEPIEPEVGAWAYLDTESSTHNGYVLGQSQPALYTLSVPDFLNIPVLAAGEAPAAVADGAGFSATVPLRQGMNWSDGEAVDACVEKPGEGGAGLPFIQRHEDFARHGHVG